MPLSFRRLAAVATCPDGGIGLESVPALREHAAFDPARSKPAGRGTGADRRAKLEQANAVPQVGFVVDQSRASPSNPGARIASRNRPRLAHPLGGRQINGPIDADNPAEALTGLPRRRARRRRPDRLHAAPQGLLCLRMHAAGSANWRTNRKALSRSSRLLYESSLPCRSRAVARFGPLVRARRRTPPADEGFRHTAAAGAGRNGGARLAGKPASGCGAFECSGKVIGDRPVVAAVVLECGQGKGAAISPVVPPCSWICCDQARILVRMVRTAK